MTAHAQPYRAYDDDELAEVDRELVFHPSTVTAPRTLRAADVETYNRRGYLAGMRIFDDAEIADIRAYFDELLVRVMAAGGDSYSINGAHRHYGRVHDLLTHRRIVDHVADILGEDVVGWGSHFFCKMPHDGKTVAWHQDASYWPLSPSKTVTVWLAIDDADPGNACMRFIPGSHRHGHIAYRASDAAEGNVLNQTVDGVERFGEAVDCALRAGEISMHSDLLVHGSRANDSDRRRCGLTLRYCAAEVRAGKGWNEKGVIVRGADPSGHWHDLPRPAAE